MPQIASFKLFLPTKYSSHSLFRLNSFPPLSLFSKPKTKTLSKPFSPFTTTTTVFSYSPRRQQRNTPPLRSRDNSTLREVKKRELGKEKEPMKEANEAAGFNKRRAEGRDKNDKPKNLQLKNRKLNPVNTCCYVQVLGTGLDTQDTSPSVLLFFDRQRFIFNAGEGLQRFCTEHKIKLSKIDHIFLSRVCSETAGGLPGLLLTLAGMGDEGMSVNVCGPSDLQYLVDAMRSFIPKAAVVHTRSFGPSLISDGASISESETFAEPIVLIDDEVVKISAILLRPSCCSSSNSQDSDTENEAVLKPGDISVIYVCELPEINGKFDPEKAKALGLKPGPKLRDLQLGKSVMSDFQNITVHPSDVMGPTIPGPIVLLVDCPTLSHLRDLISLQSLNSYYDGVKIVNCVVHLSPSSVTMTAEYDTWMRRFGGAQHIMAGHQKKNMEIPILKSSARMAARLNYLCPNFFPSRGFWDHQHVINGDPDIMASSVVSVPNPSESVAAENLLKFHLRPYSHFGLDKSTIPELLTSAKVIDELLLEIPDIVDAVSEVSHLWNKIGDAKELILPAEQNIIMMEEPWMDENASVPDKNLGKQGSDAALKEIPPSVSMDDLNHESSFPSCLENITREDMEIVLLGTGSSQPSKYRNVTSILINLFSKGGLLLDCGEGTLGQLKRRFGVTGADDAVKGLKFIWISHIHADHHTGLARILALRCQLLKGTVHDPIIVVGPRQLKRFLDAYQRLEDLNMQFLDCGHTTDAKWEGFESQSFQRSAKEEVNKDDGVKEIAQNLETSLFAKGSRMESYWKRPGNPGETTGVFEIQQKLKKVLGEAGLGALISVPVVHCPQSFGVVLEAASRLNNEGKTIPGWKLVYSGDTRPCQELKDACQGSTVLIHEATFEDTMVDEAIARNHSTTMEAIEVGEGAYRIILTHFSQRYPKIPVFDETHMHKTCIGFDMMSVNLADLPVLPKVLPHLKLLFKNEMIVEESDDVLDS
ncbi:hypothetical protein C5167_019734 [Papaver somniferum]|uniref:ribonuclease Z n=1 Tax=Papaver somniferum TaxID=3469 RepID=A0A4Y7IU93_PAPSO|nr:tRNase Z TRZ3, mitochondrial-like [Papaver somniferum]RZC51311.1 hypothetical protein C5167_019734 [Papaver somniferum]